MKIPSKELISKVLKVKVSDSKDFCLCLENSNIEYGKVGVVYCTL